MADVAARETTGSSLPTAWVTTAASFGFALVQLDVTIVNVALPRMASELQAGVSALQWIVDAYALSFAVLLLLMGFLGDRLGARRVYLAGLGLFALASLGCGFSIDAPTLIIARAAQGLAAAAMLPNSLALINRATGHDRRLRAKAIGWWTASGSIAIAAGPIVGGLLLGVASWRSIFLINLPVCAVGVWSTWRVPVSAPKGSRRSFDIQGQVLAVLALAALTAAIIQARPMGWAHPFVYGGCLVAMLASAGFIWIESRSKAPMLPLDFFSKPGFSPAVGYGVMVNLTYYGIVFVLSLYLQRVHGYSALRTGLAYLPLTATFFGVNVLSGWLIGVIGARPLMVIGALIDAGGFALLLLLNAHSSYWLMLPAFALLPAGMGLGVPAMTNTVLSAVQAESSGIASGVLNAARQAGGAVGVAVFGALAGDGLTHVVEGLHVSAWISIGLLLLAAVVAAVGVHPHGEKHP
jgi:DHA2 family methylenomycin A resistance protein-like MFS transporter